MEFDGDLVRIRVGPFEGELATVVRVRPNGGLGIKLVDNALYPRVMHYRPDEVEPVATAC